MIEYLDNHIATDQPPTHTSMIGGSYYISDNKTFYDLLATEVFDNKFFIVERHLSTVSPIVVDIDIHQNESYSLFSDYFFQDLSFLFYSNLSADLSFNDPIFIYYLKRDEPYQKDNIYKDGLHIYIPDIVTSFDYQFYLRKKLIPHFEQILKNHNINHTNKIEDVYDRSVIKSNGLILYKNWKYDKKMKKDLKPYEIYKIMQCNMDNIIEIPNNMSVRETFDRLSLRNKTNEVEYREHIMSELSVHNRTDGHHSSASNISAGNMNSENTNSENTNADDINVDDIADIYDNKIYTIEEVNAYVMLLPSKYYDDHSEWFKIGGIYYHESRKEIKEYPDKKGVIDEKWFMGFNKFSEQSQSKYVSIDDVRTYWVHNFRPNKITIKSLFYILIHNERKKKECMKISKQYNEIRKCIHENNDKLMSREKINGIDLSNSDSNYRKMIGIPVDEAEYQRYIDKYKKYITPDIMINNIDIRKDLIRSRTHNLYCMICSKIHDIAKNAIIIKRNGEVEQICLCEEAYGISYPETSITLSQETVNIIFNVDKMTINNTTNNTTNIGNTINNNYQDSKNNEKRRNKNILEGHNIFDDVELNRLVILSISDHSHMDFTEILHYLYKNKLNCTRNNVWYYYENHKWIIDSQHELRIIIMKDIAELYQVVSKYINKMIDSLNELLEPAEKNKKKKQIEEVEKKIEAWEKQADHVDCMIKQLRSNPLEDSIIKNAASIFYTGNKTFVEKLDTNPYIIGFDNGVFDLEKMEFRDGNPDDYVTMSVGYDYDKDAHSDKLIEVINQILPNEAVRTYVLKLFGLCLTGIYMSKIHFFNGSGSNGKSIIIDLLRSTLGQYAKSIPISIITDKRTPGENANPQMASSVKKRLVIFSEPNKRDRLNTGVIKEITGGDVISVRKLHNDPIEFKPEFKAFILCNHLPKIDIEESDDYSVWRRLRNILFTSKFVDNPQNENEFMKDERLENMIQQWKCAFFNLLLEYLKPVQDNNYTLIDIPEILATTNEYKNKDNFYLEFIDQHLEPSENKTDYIVWTKLLQKFTNWMEDNYRDVKLSNSKEIKQAFIKLYFKKVADNDKQNNVFIREADDKQHRIGNDKIRGWVYHRLL